MSDDGDLWSVFDGAEAGAARRAPVLPGVRAAEHAFFRDSTLWPFPGENLELQAAGEVVTADVKAHVSDSALQALKLEGEQGLEAAAALSEGWGCAALGVGYLFCCAAVACVRLSKQPTGDLAERALPDKDAEMALHVLDRAVIKSNRLEEGSSRWEFPYLQRVVGSLIQEAQARVQASRGVGAADDRLDPPSSNTLIPNTLPPYSVPSPSPTAQQVESRSCEQLSLPDFLNSYLNAKRPLVIKDYLDNSSWPALQRWPDLQHWRRQHGRRLVPVECEHGELREMTMDDFIQHYLVPSNASHSLASHAYGRVPRRPEGLQRGSCETEQQGAIGYISQHGLFHQLRETQEEFSVPIYARGAGKLAMVNAWMGTRGTVTHLHTDEHDNLLAQVAGYKYLRLAAPVNRELLYAAPHPRATPGNPLNWFSPVDAEEPDLQRHPLAAEVPWLEVILGPGDLLYIPKGYWHYVRSLSTSISVNFWF